MVLMAYYVGFISDPDSSFLSTNLALERLDLPHLLGDELPEGGDVGARLEVGQQVLLVEAPRQTLDGRRAGGHEGRRRRGLPVGGGHRRVHVRVLAAVVAVSVAHLAVVPPPLHVGKLTAPSAAGGAVAEFLLLLVRRRWGDALCLQLRSM